MKTVLFKMHDYHNLYVWIKKKLLFCTFALTNVKYAVFGGFNKLK